MSKYVKPYVIGYDLGDQTVASVAINANYNVIKQNGHKMAMVNTFSEGQSKAERRAYRETRRNIAHKKWLKKQLYHYFREHQVNGNIDETQRCFKTSWISQRDAKRANDKSEKGLYLTNGDYPTVWHAADALIKNDEQRLPQDAAGRTQLIYEVLHNFLNRRGHFLMPNLKVNGFIQQNFDHAELLKRLRDAAQDELDLKLGNNLNGFKQAMTMTAGILKRKEALIAAIQNDQLNKVDQNRLKILAGLCAGSVVSTKQLMKLFDLHDEPSSKVQLSSADVDEQLDALSHDLPDQDMNLIKIADQIYYQSQLSFLMQPGKSFVDVQLERYDQFGKDLVMLKQRILPHLKSVKDQAKYRDLIDRYVDARGSIRDKSCRNVLKTGKADKSLKPIDQKSFAEDVLKKLVKASYDVDLTSLIGQENVDRITNGNFLVKTRSVQNARVPHQAIQSVVRQIIDRQKQVSGLEWLGHQNYADSWFPDEAYDLERFFDFRIPYFVGPLVHSTDQSEFSWLVRKASGTLTVFNFTKKVDLIASARGFIKRLTAQDTYLLDEPVMASSTMTYQKYAVLDELNRLTVKSMGHIRQLKTDEKQAIYDELFKQKVSVSLLAVARLLQTKFNLFNDVKLGDNVIAYVKGLSQENPNLSGAKAKFNNSLSTYHKWRCSYGFSDEQIKKHFDDFEQIAEILTVFDQDSKLIKRAVLKKFTWLSEEQINQLSKDHLEGWGRLSKRLLTGMTDDHDQTIMDNMWYSQLTLNQCLANQKIKAEIESHRKALMSQSQTRREAIDALLDRSYAAPAVRKVVHRFAGSLLGIMKQMQYAPEMIVIESARVDGKGKMHNTPLAKQIDQVVNELNRDVKSEWKSLSASERKSLTLAQRLYFLQNGKDIYTGKPLDFNNLVNTTNVDHVVPQRLMKDDSLDNKVLTNGITNNLKSGNKCAARIVTAEGQQLWQDLYHAGMMSKAKYNHLRTNWDDPLTQHQGSKMLNRSLTETHQVNRLCAQIATMLTKAFDTKVVTMRSAVTSLLRDKSQFKNTKNRAASDLHHGVDAYLVAFAAQYLWNSYKWLRPILDYNRFYKKAKLPKNLKISDVGFDDLFNDEQYSKLLGRLNHFDMNQIRVHYETGLPAISAGGTLANATIQPAGSLRKGKNYLPVQGQNPDIYGYRNSITNCKMVLVKITKGNKQGMYRFVSIPRNKENIIEEYVGSQAKNAEIIRRDLTVFDLFEIPGTGLEFAANGDEFVLRNQIPYSNKMLRLINQKEQLNADELKQLIKQMINLIKNQYQYMINHQLGTNFVKIGVMNVDGELAKEHDIDHLREIVDDLLIGFNCSKARVSFHIGDVKFSSLGRWKQTCWPNVKMVK